MLDRIDHTGVHRPVVRYRSWLLISLLVVAAAGAVDGAEPVLLHRDLRALLSPSSMTWAGAGLVAAALVRPWDDEVRFGLSNRPVVRDVLDVVDLYGSNRYASTSLLAAWGGSRLLGAEGVSSITSELLRAVILANVLVTPLKFIVARERPDGSNNLSFPSGHSANAFALTAVIGRRLHPFASSFLYVATAGVPISRIHRRRHFLSDVIGGSIMGVVAGRSVTGVEGRRSRTSGLRYGPLNVQGNIVFGAWTPLP